jgi:hypothetical protein
MSEQARKRRIALVALAIGIAAGLAGAAPAGAYLKDFQVVSGNSLTNSSTLKTVLVPCPTGKAVLGSGGLVVPSLANLGLNHLWVNFEQGFAFDGGTESDAVASFWHVGGRGFCAAQTAVVPSTGGPGYAKNPSVPSASSAMSSASVHEAIAHCPTGDTAIGGGGGAFNNAANPSPPDVALDNSQRVLGGTAWRVRAHEVDATPGVWRATAYAICANFNAVTGPAYYIGPKEDNVTARITQPGAPTTVVAGQVAPCPMGTRVIGGGAQVLGATGPTPPPDVVLTSSYPVVDPTATGWQAWARDTDPPGPAFRLQVRAVCG